MRGIFFTALAIAVLFLSSAVAKWFFPSKLPFYLDQMAAGLEISYALLILLFFRKASAWAALTVLFSLFLGYSLFWFINNENCSCFGKALPISAGITATIDAIAIGLSFWSWGKIEPTAPQKKRLFILIDGLVLLIGFFIALTISWKKQEKPLQAGQDQVSHQS
jgi:hypothetical protein